MRLFLEKYMNMPAIITEEEIITYSDFKKRIFSMCSNLVDVGIKRGDKVAVFSQNSWEYVVCILALLYIGAIVVPVSTRWPQLQVENALINVGCNFMLISKNIPFSIHGIKTFCLEDMVLYISRPSFQNDYIDITNDNEATIIFTSGSSGRPKAALHTLKNHYYSALGSNMNINFGPGDIWGIFLPFYHVGGLSIIFRAIISGGAIAISTKKEPLYISIKKMNISHVSLVPTQLYRIIKSNIKLDILKNLKAILLGGAPAREKLVKTAKDMDFPIFTTYGSTEMASQITTTKPYDTLKHLLTSGKILPYRELKIADDGEIMVRGKTLFKGYINKRDLEKPFTKEGWFRTGDIGYIDKDGYLNVIGRKDNMFISGGENIQPEEIEKSIANLKDIIDVIVVPVEDIEWGYRPVAFVWSDKHINEDYIKKRLENYLPRYKIPDRIFNVAKDIKNKGLKLNREQFKRLAKRIMERA